MEVIGEKPKMEVRRLIKTKDGKPRPLKVSISSSLIVSQVLLKSRSLGSK